MDARRNNMKCDPGPGREKPFCLPSLTVIVPIRVTERRLDLIDRIDSCMDDSELPGNVDFLIVDDGSKETFFQQLKAKETNRRKVIKTGAKHYQDFSLARARNFAAQRATGQFIMFMDADLAPYPGFFNALLREVTICEIAEHVDRFLMCPVIYLTETGQKRFAELPPEFRQQYFINAMLRADETLIEKHSSGTSVIILERHYYLARGGQDEGFAGWGFEDYEFSNRLIRRNRQFPIPPNWLSMSGNFMTIRQYDGWKAAYRLYGDWLASKGIYLFHLPHPIEDQFHRRKESNLSYLQTRMQEDQQGEEEPAALADLRFGPSLLLRTNPFCYHREFAPFLGPVLKAHEDDFKTVKAFSEYLQEKGITQVVFPNPYGNEKLLALYRHCRKQRIPFIVCERGALPDSVFHDRTGFLNDSKSYSPKLWDRPLSADEQQRVQQYVESIRAGSHMLEKQASRSFDLAELRKRLSIKRGQKVLLVPFQQPNDTVIRYFCGPIGSFDNFHTAIAALVKELGPEWAIVYKKHPAEDTLVPIPGAIAADDCNIYDLIELSDAVAVINSGVGIYAMMFGKPLFVLGESWYKHEGLCVAVGEADSLARMINEGFELDYEKVLRFVHYLRFEFYSFGRMSQRRVRYSDGTPITATTAIDYYELRGWSSHARCRPLQWKPISKNSPLFDRYTQTTTGGEKAPPTRPKGDGPAPATSPSANSVQTPALVPAAEHASKTSTQVVPISKYSDDKIKSLVRFKIYAAIYGRFLTAEQRQRLENNPTDFFGKAKRPVSLIGRRLLKTHLEGSGSAK